jgi:hypothetical protein
MLQLVRAARSLLFECSGMHILSVLWHSALIPQYALTGGRPLLQKHTLREQGVVLTM